LLWLFEVGKKKIRGESYCFGLVVEAGIETRRGGEEKRRQWSPCWSFLLPFDFVLFFFFFYYLTGWVYMCVIFFYFEVVGLLFSFVLRGQPVIYC
jgi:hypothetical protein